MKASHYSHSGSTSNSSGSKPVQGTLSAKDKVVRDEFVAYRKSAKQDSNVKKLSPLQKRMRSGGPR